MYCIVRRIFIYVYIMTRNLGVVTRVPLILVLVKVIILIVEIVKNALHPDREPDDYFRAGFMHTKNPGGNVESRAFFGRHLVFEVPQPSSALVTALGSTQREM